MPNNHSKDGASSDRACYLPDFCHSETNLLMILVLELIAIVLALVSAPGNGNLFIYVALMSLYIQWIGLSSAALLCLLRRTAWMYHTFSATLISLLVVLMVTAVMAIVAFQLNELLRFDLFQYDSLLSLIVKHQVISLILYGLALRYFYVHFNSRQMLQTQSQARLQALQARIRPHFLFNSLNTIASLTHDEPDQAEHAIESLADLFRASLNAESSISLGREIELTRDYIELEQMRLDDRLKVEWKLDADLENISLPALTLQPLVENAIYHGIEPLPEGGAVIIAIRQQDDLNIQIINPFNKNNMPSHRKGNQMAIKNIHERLDLAFQGRAKILHLAENDLYKVDIRIPLTSPRSTHSGAAH
ncbi:MAG: histidine kinase [Gammaproteobacteria bacterium]|nr:histidine kinase [Gammaproteobacteria bacterium]